MAESPSHYGNSWEVGDFIRRNELNFHLGNAIKYICRAGKKNIEGRSLSHAYIKDLEKAIHYLQNEVDYETKLEFNTSSRVQRVLSRSIWDEWETETESFDR